MTEHNRRILAALSAGPKTAAQIARALEVSEAVAHCRLADLVIDGHVEVIQSTDNPATYRRKRGES